MKKYLVIKTLEEYIRDDIEYLFEYSDEHIKITKGKSVVK